MASCGRANGRTHTRLELQNRAVTIELYRSLLSEEARQANGLQRLVRAEPVSTCSGMTEQERRTASEAADRMSRVVASKPELAVSRSVEEFRSGGWEVTAENMEEEFGEVERRTFLDGIHWGRVIAFLAFSVSFAAYVSSRGISGGADSVFSWTTRVLDHDLSDFMSRENGWDGFITYADTLLRGQERRRGEQVDHAQPPRRWDNVAAYGAGLGAIGFGALLAYGVRQVFS